MPCLLPLPRAEEQGRERARRRQPDLGALDHGGGSEQGKKRERRRGRFDPGLFGT